MFKVNNKDTGTMPLRTIFEATAVLQQCLPESNFLKRKFCQFRQFLE